ncbi:PREDICTED: ATPase F1 complex OSCP/delta subunit [Prunus dulcis]|uniref:PREDICTED: ATPase F1 complex OSCP/delta subunit n=1 Tax=Prunus dulcis TaxID=3755 RepID=A0A5E4FV59_PRUDU|nr:PREDICTED: ATPase F1 complex OSCP/delta subunit [Prunus dulcis]
MNTTATASYATSLVDVAKSNNTFETTAVGVEKIEKFFASRRSSTFASNLSFVDSIETTCRVKGCNCPKKKFTDPIAIGSEVQGRLQLKTLKTITFAAQQDSFTPHFDGQIDGLGQ